MKLEKARETLAQTFAKYCDGVLLHEWLPWLPQLVRAAGQVEGPMVQHLLTRIAHGYPQPLYHALRCFSLDDDAPDAVPPAAAASSAPLVRPAPDPAQGGLQPRSVGRCVLAAVPYQPCITHI